MTQATDRQLSFLNSLFNEREASTPGAEKMRADAKEGKVSKTAASKWIEYLLTQPRKPNAEPPLGMHEFDGQVVKVYKTRNGYTVAKVLSTSGEKPEFQYAGKAGLKGLSGKTAMTAGAASKFGKLYGMCVNCAATLTDSRSIFVGYGPVCASRNFWPYPTAAEALEGLAAASAPPESTPVEESPVGGPEPVYEDPEVKDAEELASSDLFSLL